MIRLITNVSFPEFEPEYNTSNWDGDDAKPITKETIKVASLFHSILSCSTAPDIAPGADGTIGFQWCDGNDYLIAEVGPGNVIKIRRIGGQ